MAWYQNQRQPNNGQNPYGTPQNPNFYYPPSQYPYPTPGIPQFGNSPYYQPGYGYVPPQGPVPSVGQSIKALPKQYLNVVNHPSTIAFFQEINKANWLMIWLQLGIMIFVAILVGTMRELFAPLIIGVASLSSNSYTLFLSQTGAGSAFGLLSIITVPLSFFFGQGFQYLLAKAFNGQGSFLAQSYTALQFHVPLNVMNSFLNTFLDFIPFIGYNLNPLVYLIWLVYSIFLNVLQIKAVHRLTTGKAVIVVLIPSFVNLCFLIVVALAFLVSTK